MVCYWAYVFFVYYLRQVEIVELQLIDGGGILQFDRSSVRVVPYDAEHGGRACSNFSAIFVDEGPKMCPDILELLLKFRQNRIAFTADIEQAFLQISLADEDRNAVKFLWNDGELNGTKIKALRMTRYNVTWIRSDVKRWKPFVQNRVKEIQKNSDVLNWRYTPGEHNPADLLTRGENVKHLKQNSIWWEGPTWLKEEMEHWPKPNLCSTKNIEDSNKELRKTSKEVFVNACVTEPSEDLFKTQNYSNLHRIYRITAWCLRFINNIKNTSKLSGCLQVTELEMAETYWIKRVQERNFTNEIRALKNNDELSSESKLRSLNPFVDESGVIRVGGRLENSNLDYKQAHPIVLPDKDHLTDLIILHSHQVVGHGGIADTLNQIRDKFWLLKARRKIKSVLYNCNVCICKIFRTKPVSCKIWHLSHQTDAEKPFRLKTPG
ncbi:uncharacterized protein LOC118182487 [Stegodyphus dumicola]|uniref:uncharacterized protein LOC118182487 n=1 Tax=Stegodyphus dumicola TaxID=202533 RepID=UPI0015B1F1F8|nr:uncharacterized protein LOC118182487 [Stegodyphus dumicola]